MRRFFSKEKFIQDMGVEEYCDPPVKAWVDKVDGKEVHDGTVGSYFVHDDWTVTEDEPNASGLSVERSIITCKDCDQWIRNMTAGEESLGNLVCACAEWSNAEASYYRYTKPDDFCSYGELKEDGDS